MRLMRNAPHQESVGRAAFTQQWQCLFVKLGNQPSRFFGCGCGMNRTRGRDGITGEWGVLLEPTLDTGGAVVGMKVKDYYPSGGGKRWWLRLLFRGRNLKHARLVQWRGGQR